MKKYYYKGMPAELIKNNGMDSEYSTELWTIKTKDGKTIDVPSREVKIQTINENIQVNQFTTFLESLSKVSDNKTLINTIKTGFNTCFEGYEELAAAIELQKYKDIANKFGKRGSALQMFGEFGTIADKDQRNVIIKEIQEILENHIPGVHDEEIEKLHELLNHIESIPLDDIDSPIPMDDLDISADFGEHTHE